MKLFCIVKGSSFRVWLQAVGVCIGMGGIINANPDVGRKTVVRTEQQI